MALYTYSTAERKARNRQLAMDHHRHQWEEHMSRNAAQAAGRLGFAAALGLGDGATIQASGVGAYMGVGIAESTVKINVPEVPVDTSRDGLNNVSARKWLQARTDEWLS